MGTPGITSGPCDEAVDGPDIGSLFVHNASLLSAAFYEGTYQDNYKDSFVIFTVVAETGMAVGKHVVRIDRSNSLARQCVKPAAVWPLSFYNSTLGELSSAGSLYIDYLKSDSLKSTECFAFNSTLSFFPAHQQLNVGVNLTLSLAYPLYYGDYITIMLPGVSNKKSNFPLNTLLNGSATIAAQEGYGTVLTGADEANVSLSYSTDFRWRADWFEGSAPFYNTSRVRLYALGFQNVSSEFWVSVDRFSNDLYFLCGKHRNYSGFTMEIANGGQNTFYINETVIRHTDSIGDGCSSAGYCNGNGLCDHCSSKCLCFDGFGSPADHKVAVSDDFANDCTSRTCPLGLAVGALPSVLSAGYHDQKECSNVGVCNRATGSCECFDGYEGAACQRLSCARAAADSCSGRGRCLSMKALSIQDDALPLQSSNYAYNYRRAVTANGTYWSDGASVLSTVTWDEQLGHVCLCDSSWPVGLGAAETQQAEFFGASCELRRCPSGDDPQTSAVETNCTGKAAFAGGAVGSSGNLCHVDCSNRGMCDYSSGLCTCFHGFTGGNCGTRLT